MKNKAGIGREVGLMQKIGKKILPVIIVFAFITGLFPAWNITASAEGEWDGSANVGWYAGQIGDSFIINSAEDLAGLAALVNAGTGGTVKYDDTGTVSGSGINSVSGSDFSGKTVTMISDINISGYSWTPIGIESYSYPYNSCKFSGVFDGAGYKISGLTISSGSYVDYAGLFTYVNSGATIINVGLTGVSITTASCMNAEGAIAGYNLGTIANCYTTGIISGGFTCYAGGIVGSNSGTVVNSYSACEMTGEYSYNGGLAGLNYGGKLIDTYWDTGKTSEGVGYNYSGTNLSVGLSDEVMKGGAGSITYYTSYTDGSNYTTAAAPTILKALNGGIAILGSGMGYNNWLINSGTNGGYPVLGVPATDIAVDSQGGVSSVEKGSTLQMIDTVAPSDVTFDEVSWSVINGTGSATISGTGLLTAVNGGSVTVRAAAVDGSEVYGEKAIMITVPATGVTVTAENGSSSVVNGTDIQMYAEVSPSDATYTNVAWSVINQTGSATIDENGLLTATGAGTVTVRATEYNDSQIYGEKTISITEFAVDVTQITVAGSGGSATVERGETLQMTEEVTPFDATNPSVSWSVINGTGSATISGSGLLSATGVGTVTVTAAANDGSGIIGQAAIEIYKNNVTGVTVTGKDGAVSVANETTLQISASITPSNATDHSVTWSVTNGTGSATISDSGLLSATGVGTVTVRATSNDDTAIYGEATITVSPGANIGWYISQSGSNYTISSGKELAGLAALVNAGTAGTVRYDDAGTVSASGSNTTAGTDFSGKTITMSADIDISDFDWTPAGNYDPYSYDNDNYYSGTFDGAGHKITGLRIGSSGTPNSTLLYGGIFGYVGSGGKIQNLSVEDAAVYSNYYETCLGSLAGYNEGTMTNCHSAGTVSSINGSMAQTGGLVGGNTGTITGCNSESTVTNTDSYAGGIAGENSGTISNCYTTGSVSADSDAGGIAGVNYSGTISNCYAAGSVSVTYYAGGIVGYNLGTVSNCYASCSMSAGYCNGGIVGMNGFASWSGTVINSYWKSGITSSGVGTNENGTDLSVSLGDTVLKGGSGSITYYTSYTNSTTYTTASASAITEALNGGIALLGSGITYKNWLINNTVNGGYPYLGTFVETVAVTGYGGIQTVLNGRMLQMTTSVTPSDASEPGVTWSVISGTGSATISETGLLTATGVGNVTVRATAKDGSGKIGEATITITNPVTEITVAAAGGATELFNARTLQMSAAVTPADATDAGVTWSVVNGSGSATVSETGLLTATGVGNVTVRATAEDGSGKYGETAVTITRPVTGITVSGTNGASAVVNGDVLQMQASVLPSNATDTGVTWSVVNGTGYATISAAGLLAATGVGNVTVRATAKDGSGVFGETTVEVTTTSIAVTGITVQAAGGVTSVLNGKTLQMRAIVTPSNSTSPGVTWSVTSGSGSATVSEAGLLTAAGLGTVTVKAVADDGSGISGEATITITDPVTAITVSGEGGVSYVLSINTLQLSAEVSPSGATDKSVTWSVADGTGSATVSAAGLLTPGGVGTVTVRATANDGSGIFGEKTITITKPVSGISVSGTDGAASMFIGKTLQMSATVTPSDATDKSCIWTVTNGTESAMISGSGLLTATGIGTVTVKAAAGDGSGIYGEVTITITKPAAKITVAGENGASSLLKGKTLQMSAAVTPSDATDKSVTWSVISGTGSATLSEAGLLTATGIGTVTVRATANDGSGIYGQKTVTITNPVKTIAVAGADGVSSMYTDTALQMSAAVSPSDATLKSYTWSVINGTGSAEVSATGLLAPTGVGSVTVRATAKDGSGVYGEKTIAILKPVSQISVTSENGVASVFTGRTLQMNATPTPDDATNKSVIWSVINGSGNATISTAGLLTPDSAGSVTVRATANDGTGVYGEKTITITKPVADITVAGAGGASLLLIGNTLQMTGSVSPSDATDKDVTWSVINGTGSAAVSAIGLLTPTGVGSVTVRATAKDGSGVYGEKTIAILKPVSQISVTSENGAISLVNGTSLQMNASAAPSDATDKDVVWSVINGTGSATVSTTGLLAATGIGTVTVRATAKDGSGVYGEMAFEVTATEIKASEIIVSGENGAATVEKGGTLQMKASVLPSNITNPGVTWSVVNGTGSATISAAGFLTATAAGTVTVMAAAKDGSGITGSAVVTVIDTSDVFTDRGFDVSISGGTATVTINSNTSAGAGDAAAASVSAWQISSAVNQVIREAEKNGVEDIGVQIKLDSDNGTPDIAVTLPQAALACITGSEIDKLTISFPAVTVTFDDISLAAIGSNSNSSVTISVSSTDCGSLSDEDKELIGDRPVYDITIESGNTVISSLSGGNATVSIPYTLADGEDQNKIVVYCISDSGKLITMPDCVYDSVSGTVTFRTTHFSTYAVAYNDVSFYDVSGWYEGYVYYLTARGILNGTGNGMYSPDAQITRAQFVTILSNLSGDDLSSCTSSSFTDVDKDDWYYPSVEWAYKNKIANGCGGKFDPDAGITREQMAVMLYNYASYKGLDVSGATESAISGIYDSACISAWANKSFGWAVSAGIISGGNDGSLAPKESATRAQAAKTAAIMYQLAAQ